MPLGPLCLWIIALFPVAVISDWNYIDEHWRGRINESDDCSPSSWFCSIPDGRVTRCSFRDISDSGNGGAIYVYTYGNFRIDASLFLRCSSGNCGGAVWADTEWVDILNSCVVGCSAALDGSVLWCVLDDGNNDFYDDSFVSAASSRDGTICVRDDQNLRLDFVNFTQCEAGNSGSAFALMDSGLSFTASHLILLSLQGQTGIESRCGEIQSLSFSNIYGNRMSANGSVLWCQSHGLSVSDCIFRDNDGIRLIGMEIVPSSPNRFTFTNCVFSDDFPLDASICSIGNGCVTKAVTNSWPFHGVIGIAECPTNSPISTATHSPTTLFPRTASIQRSTPAMPSQAFRSSEALVLAFIQGIEPRIRCPE
jgi:hypothetical protein